jgi:hypothetical protein
MPAKESINGINLQAKSPLLVVSPYVKKLNPRDATLPD